MKKILVTGATGFVGANLVRKLTEDKNNEVHILTRKTSNLWRIKDIYNDIIDWKVDLQEKDLLKDIIEKINPEAIIHLAIYGGRPNENDNQKIIDCNFQGTVNLLEACKNINYRVFINTGSSSEYGEKNKAMNESDICNPNNIYGVAKIASTLYCNCIAEQENKNIGTVRLFSPFGDFEDRGRLFPDVIINAIKNKDIDLANPKAVRDFIYIKDTIDFYMNILNNNLDIKGKVYNCGYGSQHSVEYVVEKIVKYLKSDSKIKFGVKEGRKSDTEIWYGDISLAKNELNWKPTLEFDRSIEEACEWYKKNIELYEGE
ncbi:MAG: NAD-dependent epimerase/dehydratase family protein [Cetobacterium sp.]|uniref:NAD-dependent epimerase/dehydratase family protein n=1 Tax=Cetobacterium sp. TaxID=2071632 RepID=UPI003F314D14